MIINNENGFLCNEISENELARKIGLFLENPEYFDREKIRKEAVKKYDLLIQAKKYLELYQSMRIK